MATDWIKVEKTTPRKSEVLRIATTLNIHPDHAFGLCFRFWSWCDDNLLSSNAGGVSLALVDSLVDRSGFCAAMVSVGWLKPVGETFEVTKFERHLSKSAKTRGLTAKRVSKHERKTNAEIVSEALTELELELDNKEKTAPALSGEVPAPAATKPKSHGVWDWIKAEDLRDVGKVISWHNRVSKCKNPVIGPSEADRLTVVSAAVHTWAHAEDPHRLFCWMLAKKQFGGISGADEDTAHKMITDHLHGKSKPARTGKAESVADTIKGMFPEVAVSK